MHSLSVFCVFFLLFCMAPGGRSSQDECRTLVFGTAHKNGKRLINHVIDVAGILNEGSCRTLCYTESNCVSYNFKVVASETGFHKCELNNCTHQGHENELRDNQFYIYNEAENACINNLCINNGTCQTGFTQKGYRCLCTAGFSGHDCQKDTDECAAGTHDCSSDAVCENTEGSYSCKCNLGYYGDGWDCRDIDECAAGTHNCSSYVVCNNTKGGYSCTCNLGYRGNGWNCSVSFPPYSTIGCFQDNSNRAISTLEGKDPILDGQYEARTNATEKCYKAAKALGFHIFAVQAGGWCASSSNAHQTFDKYGNSAACWADGEGGGWANQVYYITGFKSVGCYRDAWNRSIGSLEGTDSILDGPYHSRENPIAKCAVAAMRMGYSMFAVQDGGQCKSSSTAPQTYDKHGKSTACRPDGEGGTWANHVYSFG